MAFPTDAAQATNTKYYAGSTILAHENVFYIQDGFDGSTNESTLSTSYDIECYMKTKNYDMADSHHFKRLMWWGADLLTTRDITGAANPIVLNFRTTWASVAALRWNQVTTRPWDTPLASPVTIQTVATNSSTAGRLFAKFLKSFRFRQINFELTLLNNGTLGEGPARAFTITAIVGSKQTVSKQVN
jgi:hypothetical protein